MKSYCLKCKKDAENINPTVSKTSNGRTMLLSNCAICSSKKSRFIKNGEAKGLLRNFGIRTPLSKAPILGDILFWCVRTKMDERVNKFLLSGDKFMPEMYLQQPRFTYSAWGPFSKNKAQILKFKETRDTSYIYKNEIDKACFQHDMASGDCKDLARRTASDKSLRDKSLNIAKNPKYDGYQRGLASMAYKFFDEKSTSGGVNIAWV